MAIPEDSQRIAELSRELGLHHVSYHPIYHVKEKVSEQTLPYIRDKIERANSGDGLVLVAQNDIIVGFLMCSIMERNDPNWQVRKIGHIGAVYVTPEYRRRKVAAALMKEALKWLKSSKIEYVDLNVVIQNEASVAAWIALGFKPLQINMIQKI